MNYPAMNENNPEMNRTPAVRSNQQALMEYDPSLALDSAHEDEIDLRQLWRILLQYKSTILAILGITLLTTIIATLLMRPIYTSSTLIEINPANSSVVKFQNIEQSSFDSREYSQTQINILQSESVAEIVINKLELGKSAEFNGKLNQRGIITGLKSVLSLFSGAKENQEHYLRAEVLKSFSERLLVTPLRKSYLVKVSFDSFTPKLSAKIVDAIALAYIELDDERRFNSTSGAKGFLEKEIALVQAKLETSEKELTQFARKHKVIDLEDKNNIMMARLRELNTSLSDVQNQRIEAETMSLQATVDNSDQLPVVLDNELIRTLKSTLSGFEAEYLELSKIYKPKYPKMQQLKAKINEVASNINQEESRLVSGLGVKFEQLKHREALLEEAVEEQKTRLLDLQDRAVTYNILKREWETNKELYKGLLERMKEVGVAAGMEMSRASVIDSAKIPLNPSSPKLMFNILVAGLLGMLMGVGVAFFLAFLDNTIKTPEQLEQLLHLPNLGVAPDVDEETLEETSLDIMAHSTPDNSYSEAFRSIRTSLTFSTPSGVPKSIMITSTSGSEGKSTSAINLAISLAKNDYKTLLIDADLRKPRLNKVFEVPASPGLSEYLVSSAEAKIYNIEEIDNMHVMVSGVRPPNPAELLSSRKLNNLIEMLKGEYDVIIFDCPPVLGLADAIVLSTKVDAVLYVVSASSSSKDAIKNSVKRLRKVNAPIIGTVVNRMNMKNNQYDYYSYYQYQYGQVEQS